MLGATPTFILEPKKLIDFAMSFFHTYSTKLRSITVKNIEIIYTGIISIPKTQKRQITISQTEKQSYANAYLS